MPLDPVLILSLFGALALVLLAWVIRLEIKLSRLLRGRDAKSLEDTIIAIAHGEAELKKFRHNVEHYLESVEKRLLKSIQGVETMRFNPFQGDGSGGNHSFSAAFLSEEGDGVVLTSLYARERVSVFAKPIKHFTSDYTLSAEEKSTIEEARKKLPKKE